MGGGPGILDVVVWGARLFAVASFFYFIYLVIRLWKVLDITSSETVHHFVRRAGCKDGPGSVRDDAGNGEAECESGQVSISHAQAVP